MGRDFFSIIIFFHLFIYHLLNKCLLSAPLLDFVETCPSSQGHLKSGLAYRTCSLAVMAWR